VACPLQATLQQRQAEARQAEEYTSAVRDQLQRGAAAVRRQQEEAAKMAAMQGALHTQV
jgi:hypothetical protein